MATFFIAQYARTGDNKPAYLCRGKHMEVKLSDLSKHGRRNKGERRHKDDIPSIVDVYFPKNKQGGNGRDDYFFVPIGDLLTSPIVIDTDEMSRTWAES